MREVRPGQCGRSNTSEERAFADQCGRSDPTNAGGFTLPRRGEDRAAEAEAAQALLAGLTAERPGFVCREVAVELVRVLERAYRFSRERIAAVLEELAATEELEIEAADDVARAAFSYRRGGPGFSDLMIVAAANRRGASPLYTFDRGAAQMEGAVLVEINPD